MLAKNYAVLDGPTLPIVAEDGDEPNDTYIEQLEGTAVPEILHLKQRSTTILAS